MVCQKVPVTGHAELVAGVTATEAAIVCVPRGPEIAPPPPPPPPPPPEPVGKPEPPATLIAVVLVPVMQVTCVIPPLA